MTEALEKAVFYTCNWIPYGEDNIILKPYELQKIVDDYELIKVGKLK